MQPEWTLRRILVPVDESDASNEALREAIEIAKRTGGTLHLVHVMDELAWTHGFEPARVFLDDVLPRMRRTGEALLSHACSKAAASGVTADSKLFIVAAERVCDQVADEALRWHADLVVAGTHARHGLDRLLVGSEAEQIVRHAPVPVLLVKNRVSESIPAA